MNSVDQYLTDAANLGSRGRSPGSARRSVLVMPRCRSWCEAAATGDVRGARWCRGCDCCCWWRHIAVPESLLLAYSARLMNKPPECSSPPATRARQVGRPCWHRHRRRLRRRPARSRPRPRCPPVPALLSAGPGSWRTAWKCLEGLWVPARHRLAAGTVGVAGTGSGTSGGSGGRRRGGRGRGAWAIGLPPNRPRPGRRPDTARAHAAPRAGPVVIGEGWAVAGRCRARGR